MRRAPLALALALTLALLASARAQQPESPIAGPVARAEEALAEIEALPADERTVENTLVALDDVVARIFQETQPIAFLAHVSTDADERERGELARRLMGEWWISLTKREDLHRALEELAAADPELTRVEERLQDEWMRDFGRAGIELPPEDRGRLRELELAINDLELEFQRNIREDRTTVAFAPEELAGVPEDALADLPRAGGLYLAGMDYPTYRAVLRYAEDPLARRKMLVAFLRRGGERNVEVLEELIALRHERSRLLGYETTAHYELEVRMAGTPGAVEEFYADLRPRLREKAEIDLAELVETKREHTGDPDAELDPWDWSFYENLLLETRYAVDSRFVQEHFPLEAVTEGLFEITQSLFGIEYRDATDRARQKGRPPWHPDVRLYEVRDSASGELLGEFYVDLFPRPGKFNHAAQFPIRLHKQWVDGSVTPALVALVCNFTKPTDEKPSLLSHGEVETYFHEFGHCLHSILTETRFAEFAGTQVRTDFVEAPSQMLENWVWDAEVLASFARHYETGEPFPEDLLESMISARNVGSGVQNERQVWLGMVDLAYHSDPDGELDTTAVQFDLLEEATLSEPVPGTYFQAAFGHLVGYEAGYYGYLWSKVFAQDMFQRFSQLGMLSPEAGRYYREKVLAKGGSVDPLVILRDYLGRDPSPEAFFEHLGLRTGEPVGAGAGPAGSGL